MRYLAAAKLELTDTVATYPYQSGKSNMSASVHADFCRPEGLESAQDQG